MSAPAVFLGFFAFWRRRIDGCIFSILKIYVAILQKKVTNEHEIIQTRVLKASPFSLK
jgi:hypothetical protein